MKTKNELLTDTFVTRQGYARARSKDNRIYKVVKVDNKKEFSKLKFLLRGRNFFDGVDYCKSVEKLGYGYIYIPRTYWKK